MPMELNPEYTTTPPEYPGWYWVRWEQDGTEMSDVLFRGPKKWWYGCDSFTSEQLTKEGREFGPYVPEPLERPSTKSIHIAAFTRGFVAGMVAMTVVWM